MVVSVCVGSSCHLKGSYYIVTKLQELIKENNLEGKIELKASFCMGKCVNGIPVTVDDDIILNCGPENIEEIFYTDIVPKVG